ncbi:MAG TPA: PIN domain-containing protein [Candidatus Limnocylindrales bacterium]|jgi:predicted nucleic acid-binding protein|nr:PIN domain-containing protein [Candidatus Limnocylindrales bacterium]
MGLTVLDAGVIIALLETGDAHHHEARAALTVARERRDRFVMPASAYAETLVAPFRQGHAAADVVDEFLDALPATVEPASRTIARCAAELRATHGNRLRLPDALVVATADVLHADLILTTDARWPNIGPRVEVIARP